MNRRGTRAMVAGNNAAWRCVCANATVLHGHSGDIAGPSLDSVVVCDQCGKVYFVIPDSVSKGAPIEVVELFSLPPS